MNAKQIRQDTGTVPAGFTKRDTAIAKGAAVCLLLIHHLYMGVLPAPMSLTGNSLPLVIATLSKVCVAIFAFLSGYGLTVGFERRKGSEIAFQKKHLLSLMKPYWLVWILFSALAVFYARAECTPSAVYGHGIRGLWNALCEFLALRPLLHTPSLNQTWWYMEAALVMYLLFPLLYRLTKKLPYLALALTAVPLVVYTVWGNNVWDTCREIYWLFPFTAGIFLARHGLLDAFSRKAEQKPIPTVLLSSAALLVCTFVRAKVGLAADTFFAVSILLFLRATVSRIRPLGAVLAYIGGYSGDIFFTHSFFYCYFVSQTVFTSVFLWRSPIRKMLAFPVLLGMSIGASIVLKLLRTRLDEVITALRNRKRHTEQ